MEKEQETSKQIFKIKELITYTPLATAVLVFFGFLNYDLYYRKLEIEIFSFLETSELIFSFVKLVYPIIVTAILMNLFAYLMVGSEKQIEMSKEDIENHNLRYEEKNKRLDFNYSFKGIYSNMKCMLVELRRRNLRIAFSLFKTIFESLFFRCIILGVWVFQIVFGFILMIFTISLDGRSAPISSTFEINSAVILGASVLWVFILLIYVYQKFAANNGKLTLGIYAGIILLVLIANLNIHQAQLAADTYRDLNVKNVRFEYMGNKYTTEGSKSLIGVTKNYIFLRETMTGENLIFRLSEVNNMVFFYDESLRKKGHSHDD